VALTLAVLAGCGSGGSSSSSSGSGSTSSGSTSTTTTGIKKTVKPIGPPPQKESFADAQKRIASVVASGDCDKINALTVSAHKNASKQKLQKSCAKLKKRLAAKPSGAQSFKGLAGVFDYATKKRNVTAVLMRTADGLYHIAYFDRFESGPTVGTPFAKRFTGVANEAFNALRDKDCEAFLKVVYAATGPGSKGKSTVCPLVENNLVAKTLEKTPSAKPVLIGGNRFFAFYGLNGKKYLTLSLAREAPSQRPAGLKKGVMVLPKGAPEYAFVRAYHTNQGKHQSKFK
jgi:hypothetical protein